MLRTPPKCALKSNRIWVNWRLWMAMMMKCAKMWDAIARARLRHLPREKVNQAQMASVVLTGATDNRVSVVQMAQMANVVKMDVTVTKVTRAPKASWVNVALMASAGPMDLPDLTVNVDPMVNRVNLVRLLKVKVAQVQKAHGVTQDAMAKMVAQALLVNAVQKVQPA